MEDKKNEATLQKASEVIMQINHDKFVPKFCTTINVGLLENKNVVLTMGYGEQKDVITIIERIVIDLNHTKQLHEVLTKLLNEAKNV